MSGHNALFFFSVNMSNYTVSTRDAAERERGEASDRKVREKYEALVNAVDGIVWELELENFSFTFVSRQAERILGYPIEQWLAEPEFWINHLHREDRERAVDFCAASVKRLENHEFDYRMIAADGRVVWLRDYVTVDSADGEATRLRGVMVDITERKAAEDRLRESEERYRLLFDSNPLPMWVYDIETLRFVAVNNAAIFHYGYSHEEFLSMTIKDIRPPEDVAALLANISKVNGGIDAAGFWRHRRKNGDVIDVDITSHEVVFAGARAELVMSIDVTERKKAEKALCRTEAKYRNLVESSPVVVYLHEPHEPFSVVYVSPNVKMFGYSPEDWYANPGMWSRIVHKEDRERAERERESAVRHGISFESEYRIVGRDGEIFWVHDKGCFIVDEQGNRTGWQGVILDVTETKRLQEQLRLSQRLESVGRMAGGIAHDFNNMLTAINGYSDMTLRRLGSDDPLRGNIEEIKRAGERSAALTQQLLAFSRRQVLKPKVLNLNDVVLETSKMLERLIGEDVQLNIVPHSGLGLVEADPGQLTQVIMNLAINARDAMPGGGSLVIETSNVFLDEEYAAQHVPTQPGAYVLLSVSDGGSGMSEEIERHIFEPFYTTKETGKGTGLGLATVYGIVKQSGGYIWVDTEIGKGTTFNIYLPRLDERAAPPAANKASEIIQSGTETILLVEDEPAVRAMILQMLETCGYTVVEAKNGSEALELCESENRKIDLLLTDVVMPLMGGRELANQLSSRFPNVRLLFTSGYTDDAVVRQGIMTEEMNFIQKPFTFEALAKKIREVLN